MAHADIADPVAALVLGSPPPLDLLLVAGRPVVENDHVLGVDERRPSPRHHAVHKALLRKAGRT